MKKGVISLLLETHLVNALREKAPALHRGKPLGGVSPFFCGEGKRPAQEDSMKKAGRLRSLTEGKAGVETMIAQPPIARYLSMQIATATTTSSAITGEKNTTDMAAITEYPSLTSCNTDSGALMPSTARIKGNAGSLG